MASPVCGLRAVLAFRLETLNVPKPTKETASPFFSERVMLSMSESTAAAAVVFVIPVSLAIFDTTSCLFMRPPERKTGRDSRACRGCLEIAEDERGQGETVARFRRKTCRYTRPCAEVSRDETLGGGLLSQPLERFLERCVRRWTRLSEFDIGLVDRDRRLESFLVERSTRRCEIASGGQPQPAAV